MFSDTIDIEEMETQPSFDKNTLMEPKSDESASDYDEDCNEDYVQKSGVNFSHKSAAEYHGFSQTGSYSRQFRCKS